MKDRWASPRRVQARRAGFSLVELLVVIAIIGVLVGLLLPAIQAAREAARGASCRNNLRQISTAIHLYHDSTLFLPPARLDKGENGAGTSTLYIILPYLEEEALSRLFDRSAAYKAEANAKIVNTLVPTYLCPSMALQREVPDPDPACQETGAPGSYAVSVSSDTTFMFAGNPPHDGAIVHPKFGATKISRITDGTSSTLLLGEKNYGLLDYYWTTCHGSMTVRGGDTRWAVAYPGITWGSTVGRLNSELSGPVPIAPGQQAYRSDHPSGGNFAFVDGSVRFIADEIDERTYKAMATRRGGETISFNQ